jgi:hypothetical protein
VVLKLIFWFFANIFCLIFSEETQSSVYELSEEQKNTVGEAQLQFKNGQFLISKQADKDIEEWLGK